MISSNSQHKIHRLVPRRKVNSGSLVDILRGDKSSPSVSAAGSRSNSAKTTAINDKASLTTTSHVDMYSATIETSRKHTDIPSPQPQHELVTPDKSPKAPREEDDSSSSSEEESEPSSHASERSLLISQIDTTKLSPDIDPNALSNYELLRLRNIQRNEAKLASLGLLGLTTKDKKTKNSTNAKPKTKPANNNNLILWNTRYQELVAFHSAHGHLTVPTSHGPLYSWTKRQKVQYKSYKEGKKCSLDDEKAGMLERLGVEEHWFGTVRTVVNNRKKDNKQTKTKNPPDSDDDEELGSLDSYSEEEEELYLPPDKSGSRIRRELERLASPKWMDAYTDDDKAKSTRGRSANARMQGLSSRYGLKSINPNGRSVVDDYSDDEAHYQARSHEDSTSRGKPTKKSMEQRSKRRSSDSYEPGHNESTDDESKNDESKNDESKDHDTAKTRSYMIRREGTLKAYESTKTPMGRRTRVKYSDDDSSAEFEASRNPSGSYKRHKSPWNCEGQRSMDVSSDDDAYSVNYEDRMNRDKKSQKRSGKKQGEQKLVDDNSDDGAYSSGYDEENSRTRSSMRSRLIQKHRGRKYSPYDSESNDYETATRHGGAPKNRRSIEKHKGRTSKDYSDDNTTNSIECSTAKRFAGSSNEIASTRMLEEHRLTEDYSDDGDSESLEHASTMRRGNSSRINGKFSRHHVTRRLPTTELQRKKSSGVNHRSPKFYDYSTSKLTESKISPVRLATRHTKTSLEQIEDTSTDDHLEQNVNEKTPKRKGFVERLERSSKRRRGDFSPHDLGSRTYHSDVASSSSISSTSASTKSSSLDHTIKPIKEVVITQTLTTHAQHKSLQLERSQLLAEYTHLYRRKCLLMEKMPRVLCELKSMHSHLIENNSTLGDRAEGPMQVIMRGQSNGSLLMETYQEFNSNLTTTAASSTGYHATPMLNHGKKLLSDE